MVWQGGLKPCCCGRSLMEDCIPRLFFWLKILQNLKHELAGWSFRFPSHLFSTPWSSYSNRKLLESFVQVHCSPGSPSSWFGGHSLDIEPVWKITPGTSHMKVAGGGRRFYSQGLSMILGDPTKGAEPSAPSKKHGIAWECMLSTSHSWNLRCLVFVKTCPGRSRACSAWHALQGTIIHCLWAWGEKEHWEWPGHSEILSSIHVT